MSFFGFPVTYYASAGLALDTAADGGVSLETNVAAVTTLDVQTYADPKDFTDVTQFTLTGHVGAIVADTSDNYTDADLYQVWVPVTIVARPEVVFLKTTGIPRILRLRPVPCRIDTGVLKLIGGVPDEGVRLVANSDNVTIPEDGALLYDVLFGKSTINGVDVDFSDMNFTFEAPFTDTTVDITTVPRVYS